MQTTQIEWRAVNAPETKTYGAQCLGGPSLGRCAEPVAYCRQWQSSAMSGPAFWYFCAEHAEDEAELDGMSLEPDAPGFADSPRSATADSVLIQSDRFSTDSVQESDSDSEDSESNPYAVGSIWHTSWGYDQTNVEYYTVVRESKASVWVVPMSATVVDGRLYPVDPVLWTTGKLCETCGGKGQVWREEVDVWPPRREDCTACDGVAIVTPEMHRKGKDGAYLRLDYVRHAWPYNGGGCYDTSAAGLPGH